MTSTTPPPALTGLPAEDPTAGHPTAGRAAAQRAEALERRLAEKRLLLATTQQQIAALEGQLLSWRAGAEGERRVAAVLDALLPDGWVALHDVRWPGRARANLDHVVVGPGGVVVIDAKNWSGEVSVRDGVLRSSGYRKLRECESAAAMAGAVAAQLDPAHRASVWSVLCLVGHDAPPARVSSGAVVVGLGQLAAMLRAVPKALTPGDVALVALQLRQQLGDQLGERAVPPVTRQVPVAKRPAAKRSGTQRAPHLLRAGAALVGGVGTLAWCLGWFLGWS